MNMHLTRKEKQPRRALARRGVATDLGWRVAETAINRERKETQG